MKKLTAFSLVLILIVTAAFSLSACKKKGDTEATKPSETVAASETAAPTEASTSPATAEVTEAVSDAVSEAPTPEATQGSSLYDEAVSVIESSGAWGYTVCRCDGSDFNQILLVLGDDDSRTYILRSIQSSAIGGIATIASGGEYTAYIDYNTSTLSMALSSGDGTIQYGPVISDGNTAYANFNATYADESEIPGEKLWFSNIGDYGMLQNYTN